MTEVRNFDISDVLSVSTGQLVSARHMDGVYDILGFMTGDPSITTIGLAMVSEACKKEILRQHPQLTGLRYAGPRKPESVDEWVLVQAEKFGRVLPIQPLPPNFQHRSSLQGDLEYVFKARKGR
jgi:hypothetical protein